VRWACRTRRSVRSGLLGCLGLLAPMLAGACENEEAVEPGVVAPEPTVTRATHSEPATAHVKDPEGDVRWQRSGTVSWRDAHADQPLRPADWVQTMADASTRLRFDETGALTRLGPDTTLRIPEQPPEITRLRHLSGRLVARLEPSEDGSRMEVELPPGQLVLRAPPADAEAGVDQVEAQVDVEEERTEIAMVRGSGRLERQRGGAVEINEDHYVSLDSEGDLLESGRSGTPVEPLAPAPGAAIRTRSAVELPWARHPEAEGYVVEARSDSGEPHVVETTDTSMELELPSGVYQWTVRALEDGEPLRAHDPRSFTVDRDRTPPRLSLRSPTPGTSVRGGTVTVAGWTDPGTRLRVDGRPVEVRDDGSFEAHHAIPRGLVNVVVSASDDLGNRRVTTRQVLREGEGR